MDRALPWDPSGRLDLLAMRLWAMSQWGHAVPWVLWRRRVTVPARLWDREGLSCQWEMGRERLSCRWRLWALWGLAVPILTVLVVPSGRRDSACSVPALRSDLLVPRVLEMMGQENQPVPKVPAVLEHPLRRRDQQVLARRMTPMRQAASR